ncbi:tetraacyldisaccharide 4'-kinase [Thalassotalea sp. M1531]|uniref:Tetraacyldisaccharide 4'-kinase n=1 Tax=Thalassotalea algicola TaxID=2716224 RepID=A0A7Y0LB21_9GAMM|nr:tetraacyldisaccharide 4'-kinase [Thalassotalea algicola]
MIERVWFHNDSAKWWLVPLLLPFTLLFWLLTALRRLLYKAKLLPTHHTDVPVVVIGNIGIGGNGKTPLAIYLIELCKKLSIEVGVVSRGYGGNAPHYPYLLNEQSITAHTGDEPLMLYKRCNVPVAVGPNRVAAVKLLEQQGCQLILADDGLQHYKMARAKEIVVVDGNRLFGNGLLLPAGPLREGTWRLNTANLIVVNGDRQSVVANQVNMTLSPQRFVNVKTAEQISVADFANEHKQVNAIAGIGDPNRFFNTLKACNIAVINARGFVDHHAYQSTDFDKLGKELPIVMTEKDAVKCQTFADENWWYLAISANFEQETENRFEQLLKQCVSNA